MNIIDLSGIWQCTAGHQTLPITIPGTLDQSHIGVKDTGGKKWHPDNDPNAALYQTDKGIRTRLTRLVTWEGSAHIVRTLEWTPPAGKRLFLDVERSRYLTLRLNGQDVPACSERSVSTPYSFEVTGLMTGHDEIDFIADNSYPTWPHDAIVFSSAATDETQTNWNGLLGYVRLRMEDSAHIRQVRVYPHGSLADVQVEIDAAQAATLPLNIRSEALTAPIDRNVQLHPGVQTITLTDLALAEDLRRWDEEEGNLYDLIAALGDQATTVRFGIRDFQAEKGHLLLNGRRIFLRSEANCAVFPETGYPPMTVEAWQQVLSVYRSYGVNMMRFHSHTPPEAAFTAADELGMLMQPELSHWNPETAFEDEASWVYYQEELHGILRMLANHPSFVMMTFGNELASGELGHRRMEELLVQAHVQDSTRLFACASNTHYGWYGYQGGSDFYTSSNLRKQELRATYAEMQGYLNHAYPNARHNYESAMAELRRDCSKPVFSFEVGQYEILPDFDEIDDFKGVTRAVNYALIREKVQAEGLSKNWKRQVEATGELSNLCYREEVEAALRTEHFSGLSLLGLQDFPGQGTALVGMLNAHLQPKPYPFAQPERFRAFFRPVLPLVLLEKYTYTSGDILRAEVRLAHYGKVPLTHRLCYTLDSDTLHLSGTLDEVTAPVGCVTSLGELVLPLPHLDKAEKLTLTVRFGEAENRYPLWVYPPVEPICPSCVYECRALDDQARAVLAQGGTVYLSPDSTREALPHSIQAQFSTDFWSVGTFLKQEGGMGQLINDAHPLFEDFPTSFHTDWQWWPMATQRAIILPERYDAIIAELDSYAYLRPMAQLLEGRCGGGRLLLSTLGLHNCQQYPECRALQHSIYRYLASDRFAPRQEIPLDIVEKLVVPTL